MPGNIANITPATIASWPEPNYVDPVERRWMPVYAGVLYGVSTLLIALRLWLRVLKQAGGLGLDDGLLAAAWFGSSMFTTVLIVCTAAYNTGRHAWDIPLENFEYIALMAWLAQFSSLVTGALTKISVLCFYRRLVAGTYSRRWKWAVIAAIIFTAAWTLTFIFMLIFNCNPTRAYWKSFDLLWTEEYKCVNTTVVNLLAGIFAALSDLYAVALPCLMTRHFDLPRRQKIALNLIFCLGLLVVGASGVRTYYLWQVGIDSDVSWMIFDAYIWAQLELQLSIICASLPALRVFLRKVLAEPFTSRGLSSRKSSRMEIEMTRSPGGDPMADDWDMKHGRSSTVVTAVEGSEGERSASASAPSEVRLWKGVESEDGGVEEREVHEPAFERVKSSRGRNNFSQPRTFYDDRP
ncbi:uncharacterized protein LTR77_002432 [Saxophila tyrrhenica]|uniref:Rhodopsin domain-containing protein n=1 Tax=Saxophila tyrrhenica TaxID=1690608 RepID=A0AAV9PKC0_9PEZI|nr:hypothetical protein LTR77_002432 [Saxophila tyrrhenica]